jgi:predicted acylesterase/phospholipase RssA
VVVMVGVSAGALVSAYYAALGDPLPRLIEDAAATTPLRLGAMALHLWGLPVPGRAARDHCAHLAGRLAALDAVSFDRLRGSVAGLGVLAFDWASLGPLFACTGSAETGHLSVGHVVRGSASVPVLFPPKRVEIAGRRRWLSDGGLVCSLPLAWAFAPPLSATHALAVQLPSLRHRLGGGRPSGRRLLARHAGRVLVVTPRVRLLRNALRGRRGLEEIFRAGREALDETSLKRLRCWQEQPPL